MSNEWIKGHIEGVIIKKLVKHLDERGYLCETFRTDELPLALKPVMSYVSITEPGVARGPHEHFEQTDIFVFEKMSQTANTKLIEKWQKSARLPSGQVTIDSQSGRF